MSNPHNNAMHEGLKNAVADIRIMAMTVTDEQTLLDNICHKLVETAGFHMVWAGKADWDSGDVNVVAKHGATGNYFDIVDVRCDDSPLGQGPTGRALRLGLHQVNHDTEFVSNYAPWRDAARKMSYRSSAAFPFCVNHKVAGAINIYSHEPYAFGREETVALDALAELVGATLETLNKS